MATYRTVTKVTGYRTAFGKFSTLEDAIAQARVHASVISFYCVPIINDATNRLVGVVVRDGDGVKFKSVELSHPIEA